MSIDRGRAWEIFGAPNDQLGSVNDPRSHLEHGVRWNEKWIYLSKDGGGLQRLLLWHRYDLVGAFEIGLDGSVEALSVPEE
ncbi:MAG: hypothetical protein HRU02_01020 [Myxococcales bacterium]|nr:hypothetical protein [Myxococcales bacterium]